MTTLSLILAAAIAASTAPATVQPADGPVAVVVTVPILKGVPKRQIYSGFEKAAPRFQQMPGLIRKYFTVGDTSFGGIYLWENRVAAEKWFNNAWRAKAVATYGAVPTVRYFEAPLVVDGAAAAQR